ncbi:hypothetical protein ACFSTC_54260 [Nonomuraea ferruginea]
MHAVEHGPPGVWTLYATSSVLSGTSVSRTPFGAPVQAGVGWSGQELPSGLTIDADGLGADGATVGRGSA